MPDPVGRNAQLVRTLSILRDLDRMGGEDLYELAKRYGTTVRTIRRDLAALEEVGLPLVAEADGKKKRWRIAYKDKLTRLSGLLDAGHYMGLRMAMDQLGAVGKSSAMFATLEDLAHKVEKALGPTATRTLAAIEKCFHSYEKQAFRKAPADVFWPLVTAISEHRLCEVTYRAPRVEAQDRTYELLPLRLFTYQGAIYLMAYISKHRSYLNLNLHRLVSLVVLDDKLKPPAGFDPEKLENAAFGVHHTGSPVTYRLRFAPWVAPYIRERTWHPTQKLKELEGGGVELSFRCARTYEVTTWVASWMAGVEALAPRSLKKQLADQGAWLVAQYGKQKSSNAKIPSK